MRSADTGRRRVRPGAAIVALGLASIVGLALLEGGARLAYRLGRYQPKIVTEAYLQPNPYLYQILKPGSHTQIRNASIDVNSLGFRGPEFSAHKPAGTYRVFVLGGSTTFGYPDAIPTTEDTYPFKMEQALRRRLGTSRVEVINAGVTGYSLRTNVVNYATRVTWYQPDLIIVYHSVNDLISIREEDDLYESVVKASAGPTALEQIRNRSFLLLELNFRFYKYFEHPAFEVGEAAKPSDEPSPVALVSYERNLRHLVEMARGDGVDVVIGNESTWIPDACTPGNTAPRDATIARTCFQLQWYFSHLTLEGVRRSFEAVARIQQRVASDYGLTWVDMNPVVPRSAEYYWDFCHTRPPATTLIADKFADETADRIERALASKPSGALGRAAGPNPDRGTAH